MRSSGLVARGGARFRLAAHSTPQLSVARRSCPTSSTEPAEVVRVGDAEAVLLRLERLPTASRPTTLLSPAMPVAHTAEPPVRDDLEAPAKVLLLDDSTTWLVMTRSTLLHRNFKVQAVSTLSAFMTELESWRPDVVLAHVNMPEVSGDELCRAIKLTRPFLPVRLYSDTDQATLSWGRSDGALAMEIEEWRSASDAHARAIAAFWRTPSRDVSTRVTFEAPP